ncbi:hypothetical protein [Rufibacter immobilis]|uniref:hypothetical protein n=1 Tax=Rufibacter immobilis TaxID=1348778 RepID=UPI0011CE993F|nr:hypothetical protein [Rufibacter immobilis]
MKAIIKIKFPGDYHESVSHLHPDQPVSFNNQRPNGKEFNWIGEINGIRVNISNGRRYSSQLDLDSRLDPYRDIIARAISDALREWD